MQESTAVLYLLKAEIVTILLLSTVCGDQANREKRSDVVRYHFFYVFIIKNMKVKTSELKSIIKEAVSNMISNPLAQVENEVKEIYAKTNNEIESLSNKIKLLEKVMPTVETIYKEISEKVKIKRAYYSYGRIELELEQAIMYNEGIEDFIEEFNHYVDEMLKDAIHVDYHIERNGIINSFYIEIELDYIQGWI